MTKDDIAQKLALLPEEIAERNLQSWEPVVLHYKEWTEHPLGDILPNNFQDKAFPAIYKLVKDFSSTEQAKLFRGGTSVDDLFISTADEHGLKVGDRFVSVTFRATDNIIIQYEIASPITLEENLNVIKRVYCEADDNLMLELQHFLDILWHETRGKKNV
jgi:hypothetical protein